MHRVGLFLGHHLLFFLGMELCLAYWILLFLSWIWMYSVGLYVWHHVLLFGDGFVSCELDFLVLDLDLDV